MVEGQFITVGEIADAAVVEAALGELALDDPADRFILARVLQKQIIGREERRHKARRQ